jgi:hypothetical protein
MSLGSALRCGATRDDRLHTSGGHGPERSQTLIRTVPPPFCRRQASRGARAGWVGSPAERLIFAWRGAWSARGSPSDDGAARFPTEQGPSVVRRAHQHGRRPALRADSISARRSMDHDREGGGATRRRAPGRARISRGRRRQQPARDAGAGHRPGAARRRPRRGGAPAGGRRSAATPPSRPGSGESINVHVRPAPVLTTIRGVPIMKPGSGPAAGLASCGGDHFTRGGDGE